MNRSLPLAVSAMLNLSTMKRATTTAKNRSLYREQSCRERSNALKRVCFDDDERVLICGMGAGEYSFCKVQGNRGKEKRTFLPAQCP